ncbi:MAG: hypothetical protein JO222_02370 [Frankiales bacterium]|nr:hypothetical protein [Frankiales bacterium]
MPEFADTPILASVIADLGERRRFAAADAERLRRRLADVEAMHEPDADGECPTCRAPAPCPTLRLARGEVDYETACAAVRGLIDLTAYERLGPVAPSVPRLADLLSGSTDGIDRFFDVLLATRQD